MADWRLFTQQDYNHSGISQLLQPPAGDEAHANERASRVLASPDETIQAVRQIRYRVTQQKRRSKFEHGGGSGAASKIPRAHIWRTYRFSEGETLLGILSIKASEAFNLIEVDVFLATEFPDLPADEVTRQMLLFIFCDAVRCGTSLAVRMTEKSFAGRVPDTICSVAARHGVELNHADQGAISPEESRELFLKLCQFSSTAEERIRSLHTTADVSPERICYLMCAGIWTRTEIEFLMADSPLPEVLLGSCSHEIGGVLHSQSMVCGRSALIAEMLYRCAARSESVDKSTSGSVEETGGPDSQPDTEFSGSAGVVQDHAIALSSRHSAMRFPGWSADSRDVVVPVGTRLVVVIRPYELDLLSGSGILKEAQKLSRASSAGTNICLAVPYDFHILPEPRKTELVSRIGGPDRLLVCPDLCCRLTTEAIQKVRRGEYIRS